MKNSIEIIIARFYIKNVVEKYLIENNFLETLYPILNNATCNNVQIVHLGILSRIHFVPIVPDEDSL